MSIKPKYDVVILGAGHNGLVAAGYLARAGLRVLLLAKNDYNGGATTSQKLFPDYDARLSRYSYLVSLLPDKIIRDLGLNLELRSRTTASFTPYQRDGAHHGLLLSNVSEGASRASLLGLCCTDLMPSVQPDGNVSQPAFLQRMDSARAGLPQSFAWQLRGPAPVASTPVLTNSAAAANPAAPATAARVEPTAKTEPVAKTEPSTPAPATSATADTREPAAPSSCRPSEL